MSVSYVRRMVWGRNQSSLFAAALMLGAVHWGLPCRAAELASAHVQGALRAEIELDGRQRAELIDAALQEDPNSAEAHWARGEVRVEGEWRSLEDSAAQVLSRADVLKYWERRAAAGKTVVEQMRLADYCRTHGMPGAERAHLISAAMIDPDHREARRRLGQVNSDGVWIDLREFEQRKKQELATAAYLKKHGKRLMALAVAFQQKSKSEERLLKELRDFDSPLVIPGLEYCFSSMGEAGALCTVEALAAMPAPEASMSLVRHALAFTDRTVRKRAIEHLKERDEFSFIPELLAELRTPVAISDGFETNFQNQIVWRRRLMSETQGTRQIADLDRIFQLGSSRDSDKRLGLQVTQLAVVEADTELHNINSTIEEHNQKIMQLLAATTEDRSAQGVESRKTPDDWWAWWSHRIESYSSEPKRVAYVREKSYREVTPFPIVRRVDCLAAGTSVWTETGPLAVEEVKAGDLVLTKNPTSGELKFAPVLLTMTRPPECLMRLTINNETVRATGGHLFWVTGKGWTKARSLQPGMGLHAARGFAVVDSVIEEQEPAETYNLIVDECHSYFVGKNLVLSHDNSACQPVANKVPGLK